MPSREELSPPASPLVSVAIPLYRSARFLDVIVQNITRLDYPNLEILVSDRHVADDTLARLRARFAADSRVRFLEAHDQIDWVDHYNELLRAVSGRYFMWMPHDDSFPPDYVARLVALLEADPASVIAFGRIETLDPEGRLSGPGRRWLSNAPPAGRRWSAWSAFRLMLLWNPGVAFRGLIRREATLSRGLTIRPTRDGVGADIAWVFALSLVGRLCWEPSCRCTKRYHAESTSAARGIAARHRLSMARVSFGYLWDLRPRPLERIVGALAIVLKTTYGLLWGRAPGSRAASRSPSA